MNTQPIRFYFDFISPYAYLSSQLVDALGERHNCRVEWHPLLLGVSVLKIMGLKAAVDTPLKGPYARHDVQRFARYLQLPFTRPQGRLNPLPALRTFVYLQRHETPAAAARFARQFFHVQWGEGRNISEADDVALFAGECGYDPERIREAIEDAEIKTCLRNAVDQAIERGVFGVPTFEVNGELFWGADRMEMFEKWLETGGW